MKAPENLYLFENPIDGTPDYRWLSKRSCSDDIEYIRTDTFIDKACEWLKSNLYDYAGEDDKRNIVPFDEAVYEDFRKAMKGE